MTQVLDSAWVKGGMQDMLNGLQALALLTANNEEDVELQDEDFTAVFRSAAMPAAFMDAPDFGAPLALARQSRRVS